MNGFFSQLRGDKEGDTHYFFYWRHFVAFFPFFEHPMTENGVGIGKNRCRFHLSLAAQSEAMNGSGWNHNARLTFNLMLFVTDPYETFALHVEENQHFLGIMPVQRRAFLTLEIMQPDR